MYDLLIVGAGITAAALAATLKDRLKICVIDSRRHIGGNCYDFMSQGTLVHQFGPHIFHCPSPRIVAFLSNYTQWIPYRHTVTAEICDRGELRYVPFPYCRQTETVLGRQLSSPEVLDYFFRGYSRKMWGMEWEDLPNSVRGRIPSELTDTPLYYRDQFVALPRDGYTHMMGSMFDGVEIILGAEPQTWTGISAKQIVYTGRPDLLPLPGTTLTIGETEQLQLGFRTLDISFASEQWRFETICLHACTAAQPWTRKTAFGRMTGGESSIVSTETPRQAEHSDLTPYYPIELPANQQRLAALLPKIHAHYPNLHLLGRLGTYRYLDMYQAVGQALALAERVWKR